MDIYTFYGIYFENKLHSVTIFYSVNKFITNKMLHSAENTSIRIILDGNVQRGKSYLFFQFHLRTIHCNFSLSLSLPSILTSRTTAKSRFPLKRGASGNWRDGNFVKIFLCRRRTRSKKRNSPFPDFPNRPKHVPRNSRVARRNLPS